MKILTALLVAVLFLAGCSGSSDDEPTPDVTAETSTPSDRDELDRQAKEQAAQIKEAQDQLADEVKKKAADNTSGAVSITIKDGEATPQGARVEVEVGQKITLNISSDASEEIHVHSEPEHTYQVGAGDSISKSFTIDTPGQVAVEAHHLGVTIVQLVVRP